MQPFKFEVGEEVKDKVTGFTGIIVCRSQFLTGCNGYSLQSKKLKDNKPADWVAFDEDQLERVGQGLALKVKDPGGPKQFEAAPKAVITK